MRHAVQEELAAFKKQQSLLNDSAEMIRMKEKPSAPEVVVAAQVNPVTEGQAAE